MQTAQKLPVRKDIRLPNYDYSSPGWYFVTICTKHQKPFFSPVISHRYGHIFSSDGIVGATQRIARPFGFEMAPFVYSGPKGRTDVVRKVFSDIEKSYLNIRFDFYSVMPNHIHMIVVFESTVTLVGETGSRPYKYRLGDIIGVFKAKISKSVGESLWQCGFYEHIIRSEGSLDRIRNYILANPDILVPDWKSLDPRR